MSRSAAPGAIEQRLAGEPAALELGRIESTVQLLSVMAHPARLSMLLALSRSGPLSAGALTELSGLEQSAASHQLKVLRDARLVDAQREGKRVIYRLTDLHVARIVEDAMAHASETLPR